MAFFLFHSVGWWLLLCCIQIWIGCRANITGPPPSWNTSDANDTISTTLPPVEEDSSHLTTFFLPPSPLKPSAFDTLRSLVKVDSTENENLPEEENDVLPTGEHDKAFDEVDIDKSHAEKCADDSRHDCFHPSMDETSSTSSTVAVTAAAAENVKKEGTTSTLLTSGADDTPTNEVFTRFFTLPSLNSSNVFGVSSNDSQQDEPTPAPTSENIIPVESPPGDRKDSDVKEPTAPLSHDEKSPAKHVGAPGHRPRGEADHHQQPKALTVPDEKDPGPNEPHDVHHVPLSEVHEGGLGNDNVVNSEAGITKPVEVQHTSPKDAFKEIVKHPDDPKKQEQQPTKEEKNFSPTEPFSRSTAMTSDSFSSFTTSSDSFTPSMTSTSVISTTTNVSESTTPTTTPTTGSTPTPGEPETRRTTRFTTTTAASTSPNLPVRPTRITNKTCSDLPVCVKVRVSGSVCDSETNFFVEESLKAAVVDVLHRHLRDVIHPGRVVVRAVCDEEGSHRQETSSDSLLFFITDTSGEYEEDITAIAGVLLRRLVKKSRGRNSAQTQIISAKLVERGSEEEEQTGNALTGEGVKATPSAPFVVTHNSGMIAAVAISAVAGACLCLLCLLMVVMKQRLAAQQHQVQNVNGHHRPPNGQLDAYSLDSFSINASFRRRRPGRSSVGSFTNHGFVGDHDDMALLSKRMSSAALAALLKNHKIIIEEEFQKIPMNMPKPREIPVGAEVKNRYVNVVPNPKTRVLLADNTDDPVKTFINANYVRGYDNRTSFYIACQSPLADYVEDFWKMVWEQQSRVILMLTMLEENGIRRCAPYFPESTLDCRQLYGDYQITLLKKDIREFYTLSVFKLYCIEKNLFREIRHFWFTAWPGIGVPKDPMSLVTYLLQARPFTNCNSGPTVVHCSAGTGRTGTVIALDRCMREYEESRTMDIVQCVAQIRRDRGGAVQNKQQYLLIHEAMMEYASYTANQSNRASIQSNQLEDEGPSSLLRTS